MCPRVAVARGACTSSLHDPVVHILGVHDRHGGSHPQPHQHDQDHELPAVDVHARLTHLSRNRHEALISFGLQRHQAPTHGRVAV
eukprot:7743109-Pyramimonas_sp.AAC.1